jgi:flagellar biosynthesis anti-sigma factor FlgM
MKIYDNNVHINFEAYAQKSREAAGSQAQPRPVAADAAPVDKVVLSPKALEIQEARKLLDEIPDTDEAKVAHIRLQLESGAYKIDGSQIAEHIMRDVTLNNSFNMM